MSLKGQSWFNFQKFVAEKVRGVVTPGSGNTEHKKLDVESKTLLIECKDTGHQSYRLTEKEWEEVLLCSAVQQKLGVQAIRFSNGRVIAVMDFDDFLAAMEIGGK